MGGDPIGQRPVLMRFADRLGNILQHAPAPEIAPHAAEREVLEKRDAFAVHHVEILKSPDSGSNYFVIMKVTLVRIGNSRGIRLPKPVIEQCGFEDEVEMEVHNHELVIRSCSQPREGWAAAFARMAASADDELLDRVADTGGTWDEEEWEW